MADTQPSDPDRPKRTPGGSAPKRVHRVSVAREPLRVERVGGRAEPIRSGYALRSLEMDAPDPLEFAELVKEGLPVQKFEVFQRRTRLSAERIRTLANISERTLARRRSEGGRLSRHESESLVRLAKVYDRALDLFEGDADAALAWLDAPNRALGGRQPFAVADTDIGAREVEALIGRLEHGVFS